MVPRQRPLAAATTWVSVSSMHIATASSGYQMNITRSVATAMLPATAAATAYLIAAFKARWLSTTTLLLGPSYGNGLPLVCVVAAGC